jgi:tRNA(fMet)-specific endonuclease VapC
MTHLLDTNACVAALRGSESVRKRLSALTPDDIGISVVSIYELHTGVEKCRNPELERSKLSKFLAPLHILPFDADAAMSTAKVRAILESKGCSIGPYDLMLAGHALSLGLTFVTRNLREFKRVDGLILENWEP